MKIVLKNSSMVFQSFQAKEYTFNAPFSNNQAIVVETSMPDIADYTKVTIINNTNTKINVNYSVESAPSSYQGLVSGIAAGASSTQKNIPANVIKFLLFTSSGTTPDLAGATGSITFRLA